MQTPTSHASEGRNIGVTGSPGADTACIACRTRHLKCDRRSPCSRCIVSGSECRYIPSRRGSNRPRRAASEEPNDEERNALASFRSSPSSTRDTLPPTLPTTAEDQLLVGDDATDLFTASLAWGGQSTPFNSSGLPLYLTQTASFPPTPSSSDFPPRLHPSLFPSASPADRCLASFYRNFHPAHPFVLPEQFLLGLTPESSLQSLLASMRWVGSLYINMPIPTRAAMFDEAHAKVTDIAAPRDGFLVQAMMVLLVGMDGLCEFSKAREMLRAAGQLAVEIGLHTRSFASLRGGGVPVVEESWRRTWWDLYVVDAMVAGLHRAGASPLRQVYADVALPCEEWQYISGAIPTPLSVDSLETHIFEDTQESLSAFAYRIQSARTLGQLLQLRPSTSPHDKDFSRIEASLTNWRLHLPRSKSDAVSPDGSLDEIMFQAHMIHQATSILLHYSHSQLDSPGTARNVNSCTARNGPLLSAAPGPAYGSLSVFNAHTQHVIAAAGEISRLITHRAPLRTHTPFFTCVVVLASVAQLNQWACLPYACSTTSNKVREQEEAFLRDKIRLSIGALSDMSEVWRTAAVALGQVRGVAREIYQAKKQRLENGAALQEAITIEECSGVRENSLTTDAATGWL